MGQKSNPKGLRLGINQTWDFRWYSKRDRARNLAEDLRITNRIFKKYVDAGIAKVEIQRAAKSVTVKVFTGKPGKLIGKQGKGIDLIREEVKSVLLLKDTSVKVDVFEVKDADTNAQLVSLNVAQQLEKRISFRRAMKKVMQQAMKSGAKGIKVRVSGRLNGAEMARTEWYMEGRVPLHTLRADIDYATSEASTTYGIIGVKVWLFKGEILGKNTLPKSSRPVVLARG